MTWADVYCVTSSRHTAIKGGKNKREKIWKKKKKEKKKMDMKKKPTINKGQYFSRKQARSYGLVNIQPGEEWKKTRARHEIF